MKTRKFKELYNKLFEMELSQAELAERMGCSGTYVCQRMTGKMPWGADDIVQVVMILELPACDVVKYFFPELWGQAEKELEQRDKETRRLRIAVAPAQRHGYA